MPDVRSNMALCLFYRLNLSIEQVVHCHLAVDNAFVLCIGNTEFIDHMFLYKFNNCLWHSSYHSVLNLNLSNQECEIISV